MIIHFFLNLFKRLNLTSTVPWVFWNFFKNFFKIVFINIIVTIINEFNWFMAIQNPRSIYKFITGIAWQAYCRRNLIITCSLKWAGTNSVCKIGSNLEYESYHTIHIIWTISYGHWIAVKLPVWVYSKAKNLLTGTKMNRAIHFNGRFK